MSSVQARLRRTFKLKNGDGDGDDEDDGNRATALDEIQQESLINSLDQSAQSTDLLYTRILTVLSLVAILPFFFFFFSSSSLLFSSFPSFILTALAILSLLLTSWTTYFVPPLVTAAAAAATTATGITTTTTTAAQGNSPASSSSSSSWLLSLLSLLPFRWPEKETKKPVYDKTDYVAQVLTWLNLGVVSLLFVVGSYSSWYYYHYDAAGVDVAPPGDDDDDARQHTFSLLLLIPGVVFGAVSLVRQSMADVQGGVRELHGLRYELKGA